MEILSIGEKIKRARIYKGYTLKEVCEDKVSVSKMSCIENGKIEPEQWILDFIAEKLNMDKDYLNQDIYAQVANNITILKQDKNVAEYEEKVEYNLNLCNEKGYFDLAFQLMHLSFTYYLKNSKNEKIQLITSEYYDLYQKSSKEEDAITYYIDIAKYLFANKEYFQAATYFNTVRKILADKKEYKLLIQTIYNEAACYLMVKNYERAYEIAIRLVDLLQYQTNIRRRADGYQMLALLCLRLNKGNFEEYEKQSYELYKDQYNYKAQAIYNYAVVMFQIGLKEKALEYIEQALKWYPKHNKEDFVGFMILIIDELIYNRELTLAQVICDEALDYAIHVDNMKFIERAYYYKALILQLGNDFSKSEMYMNLSLDVLLKVGKKEEIYQRYMKMGDMYHRLKNVQESIKYFALAIALEKKL